MTTLAGALADQSARAPAHELDRGVCIAEACRLAALGFYQVPIVPSLKRPPFRTGPGHADEATRDPEVIAGWYEGTDWEIGLVLHLSGHVAIDVDLHRETAQNTISAFTRLESSALTPEGDTAPFRRRFSDVTATQLTPNRGWHYIFALPAGVDGQDLRNELAAHIELQRHILVVAPSRGRRWIRDPEDGIATFPEALTARAHRPRRLTNPTRARTRPAMSGLVHTVQTAGTGNRNRALYWAACRLAEHDYQPGDPDALVFAALDAGLGIEESIRTVESGIYRSRPRSRIFDPEPGSGQARDGSGYEGAPRPIGEAGTA